MSIMLPLHVFNMGGEGGLKPFHIPAAIACVLSFFLINEKGKLYKYVIWFLVLALISTILSYAFATAYPIWVNTFIVFTSCIGLAYVDSNRILRYIAFLIPVDVVVLFYDSIVEPQYRYQGFYNDPNYLCTTLIIFVFILFIIYSSIQNKIYKAGIIVALVLIYILIFQTLSRTGLACSLFLLLSVTMATIRKHFIKLVFVVIIGIGGLYYYAADLIDNRWNQMYERIFEKDDNIEGAGSLRVNLSLQNIRYIFDNPQFIFLGLGGGTTNGINAREVPGLSAYRTELSIDHNTWTSTFSEQALICFILFFVIIYITFNNVRRIMDGTTRYLSLGVFFSILIFSFSISQKTYLPFWWIIFFLNNKSLIFLEIERK